jgi:hypothetical protein
MFLCEATTTKQQRNQFIDRQNVVFKECYQMNLIWGESEQ